MTLRRFALVTTQTARTGAVLAVLALVGFGVAAANTEAVVAGRFTAALEIPSNEATAITASSRIQVSGTEAYWLAERQRLESDGAAVEPATWSGPLGTAGVAVGDRISVPGGKSQRLLQVVAIANVEPAPGTVPVTTAPPVRQIAITCRDLSTPGSDLVTFVVPAETASASLRPARAL